MLEVGGEGDHHLGAYSEAVLEVGRGGGRGRRHGAYPRPGISATAQHDRDCVN